MKILEQVRKIAVFNLDAAKFGHTCGPFIMKDYCVPERRYYEVIFTEFKCTQLKPSVLFDNISNAKRASQDIPPLSLTCQNCL